MAQALNRRAFMAGAACVAAGASLAPKALASVEPTGAALTGCAAIGDAVAVNVGHWVAPIGTVLSYSPEDKTALVVIMPAPYVMQPGDGMVEMTVQGGRYHVAMGEYVFPGDPVYLQDDGRCVRLAGVRGPTGPSGPCGKAP